MVAYLISALVQNLALKNFYRSQIGYISTTATKFFSSTVSPEEVEKFNSSSNEWWSGQSLQLLHTYNSVRVPFIRDGLLSVSGTLKKTPQPLKGYSILDVGCGGGILSEPLARLGASVTGIDPGKKNIEAAIQHASLDESIKNRLNYVCDTVENHVSLLAKYDAIVCSEVIEHVINRDSFVSCLVELTKDGGSLFFTTINRTSLSYLSAIIFAEYVAGLIDKGTHDWNKFVEPKELSHTLESLNCRIVSIEGIMYNPVTKNFGWCPNQSITYALHAIK